MPRMRARIMDASFAPVGYSSPVASCSCSGSLDARDVFCFSSRVNRVVESQESTVGVLSRPFWSPSEPLSVGVMLGKVPDFVLIVPMPGRDEDLSEGSAR